MARWLVILEGGDEFIAADVLRQGEVLQLVECSGPRLVACSAVRRLQRGRQLFSPRAVPEWRDYWPACEFHRFGDWDAVAGSAGRLSVRWCSICGHGDLVDGTPIRRAASPQPIGVLIGPLLAFTVG